MGQGGQGRVFACRCRSKRDDAPLLAVGVEGDGDDVGLLGVRLGVPKVDHEHAARHHGFGLAEHADGVRWGLRQRHGHVHRAAAAVVLLAHCRQVGAKGQRALAKKDTHTSQHTGTSATSGISRQPVGHTTLRA